VCRMKKGLHPEYHEEAKVSFCQLLCSPSACPCSRGSCRGRCSRPTQAGGAWRDGVTAGAAASSSFGCSLQQHGAELTGARPALALRRLHSATLGMGGLQPCLFQQGAGHRHREPATPPACRCTAMARRCSRPAAHRPSTLSTSGAATTPSSRAPPRRWSWTRAVSTASSGATPAWTASPTCPP